MMIEPTTTTHLEIATATDDCSHEDYDGFLVSLRRRFAAATASNDPLFTTDAPGLFDAFLAALPAERRKHYACHACRRFVQSFGGLVTIDSRGAQSSIVWDPEDVPPFFRVAVAALAHTVRRAKANGVFLSEEKTWGMPSNQSKVEPFVWHHMAVTPDPERIYKPSLVQTTSQRIAELLQDYQGLCRALGEFSAETVKQALALLIGGNLYRSEKCIGVARWLHDLHEARAAAQSPVARDNITWRAVASAPAGFCHVRSGMIGTLLEDIAAGLPFEEIRARFDAKMSPLQYQRPQAAPTQGNIAQAEKIVAALASAGSLARRFARIEDLETVWRPKAAEQTPPPNGVFGHLKPKDKQSPPAPVEQPPVTLTWEKFARTILPDAERIEFRVPREALPYAALVTAVNKDAPPIIQWDRPERRNPVTWFLYHQGSTPDLWDLDAGWCAVTAIALQPSMWDPDVKHAHQGESVFLLLDGAKDMRRKTSPGARCGGGFFPEHLRAEYHGVRASMEAYARSAELAGWEEATACGLKLENNAKSRWSYTLRVTTKLGQMSYALDRWD